MRFVLTPLFTRALAKLLGFDIGVTVEGGLPIPVTTPAYATAYDIVGQGTTQATAMTSAFDLSCRMGSSHRAPTHVHA